MLNYRNIRLSSEIRKNILNFNFGMWQWGYREVVVSVFNLCSEIILGPSSTIIWLEILGAVMLLLQFIKMDW